MKYTQFLNFEITRECNLAKQHKGKCPNLDADRYGDLDTSRTLTDEIILECAQTAYERLGFRGNIAFHYYCEPTCAWDRIVPLMQRIKAQVSEARFTLWTNGVLLTPDTPGLDLLDQVWLTNYQRLDWSWLHACVPRAVIFAPALDGRKNRLQSPNHGRCLRMYNELTIDHYGNGHICCMDWRGEHPIGNVFQEGFQSIVNAFLEIRALVARGPLPAEAPSLCRVCPIRQDHIGNLIPPVAEVTKQDQPWQIKARSGAMNGRKVGVVFASYKLPLRRAQNHFCWNDKFYRANRVRVFAVTDQEFVVPDYAECVIFPISKLPVVNGQARYSPARTRNAGVQRAIEAGCELIVCTDVDIAFEPQSWQMAMNVDETEAAVPVYYMSHSDHYADRAKAWTPAPLATGTVTMTAENWKRIPYEEQQFGYGCDDGLIVERIGRTKLTVNRAGIVYHMAHIGNTPQKEFDQANPRIDHWNRASGFNPENFKYNSRFHNQPFPPPECQKQAQDDVPAPETTTNEQEGAWAGRFGNEYIARCDPSPEGREPFFAKVLKDLSVKSLCEIGPNRGANLAAVSLADREIELTGIEINQKACKILRTTLPHATVFHNSFLAFVPTTQYDLVLTCGFLIHVRPRDLHQTYQKMVNLSRKYILICEYFHPKPVARKYRADRVEKRLESVDLLFVRDFAKDLVEQQPLTVLNYGFLWKHQEPHFDNLHWWLLEKETRRV